MSNKLMTTKLAIPRDSEEILASNTLRSLLALLAESRVLIDRAFRSAEDRLMEQLHAEEPHARRA